MEKTLLHILFKDFKKELDNILSENPALRQRVASWGKKAGIREKTLRTAALKIAEEYHKAITEGANPAVVVMDSEEVSRHIPYRKGFSCIWIQEEFKEMRYIISPRLHSTRGSLEEHRNYLRSLAIRELELKEINPMSKHLVVYALERR